MVARSKTLLICEKLFVFVMVFLSPELGIELDEQWVICNAAAYLWNYTNHLLSNERYSELVPIFEKVLFGLKEIGHSR